MGMTHAAPAIIASTMATPRPHSEDLREGRAEVFAFPAPVLYSGCHQLALEGDVSWGDRAPGASPRRRPRFGPVLWALLPLLSWGLLAPVPFIHAAVRLRTVGMWLVAACYVLAWAVVGPAGVLAQDPDPNDAVAAFSQLGLVVAATAHAFVLRPRVFPAPGAGDPAVAAAIEARERRQRARAMLASDPALARELRIGRPDLPRQFEDGGLVDVNHVPAQVLVDRLGLSPEEAARVVEARAQLGRYGGPAELAVYAELPDAAVEAVRDRLLFLGD
jgi:hypothetical protein